MPPFDRPAYQRERRAAKRARGECRDCPNPAMPDAKRCAACVERDKARRLIQRAAKQRPCRDCGAPAAYRKTRCEACATEATRRWARTTKRNDADRKRAEGECARCLLPALPNRRRCAKHAEMARADSNRRNARKREEAGVARRRSMASGQETTLMAHRIAPRQTSFIRRDARDGIALCPFCRSMPIGAINRETCDRCARAGITAQTRQPSARALRDMASAAKRARLRLLSGTA